MVSQNLAFIETSALLQELLGRYEHAVFAGLSIRTAKEECRYHRSYVGNPATVLGLCDIAKVFVIGKFVGTLKDDEEGGYE